jgi:predicted O-methyltransferase YrrM
MFHSIPEPIFKRMAYLEAIDAQDRIDGTPHLQRLRQIPPETGRFLALLAASAPAGGVLEIGTSAGYSSLWLSLACRERGDRLTTFEVLPEKVRLARETFRLAGVEERVELVHADARERLAEHRPVAFCFLDAEKDLYPELFNLVIAGMARGGILVADNVISHQEALQGFIDQAMSEARVDAVVVPIGKGLLVCRMI